MAYQYHTEQGRLWTGGHLEHDEQQDWGFTVEEAREKEQEKERERIIAENKLRQGDPQHRAHDFNRRYIFTNLWEDDICTREMPPYKDEHVLVSNLRITNAPQADHLDHRARQRDHTCPARLA
jgi:hypothetical protein